MAKLLIVYHSKTGGSRQMAEAAEAAAREEATTILKTADRAGPDNLRQADGYIFCAPENLAAIAGAMKDFSTGATTPFSGASKGVRMPRWFAPAPTERTRRAKRRGSPKVGGSGKFNRR